MSLGRTSRMMVTLVLSLWIAATVRAGLVNYWTFDGNMFDTAAGYVGSTSTSATDMEAYQADQAAHPSYVEGPVPETVAVQTVGGTRGAVLITHPAFDGTADVAFAPDSTLAFWVMLPTTTSEFFTDGNRFDHMKVISWGNGSVDVQFTNVPTNENVNVTVPVQEWHFLTITTDDKQDLRSVYMDGGLQSTGAYLEQGTPVPKYICLGVPDKATYWGVVAFARMSVWDHALTESEVACLYEHDGAVGFPCVSLEGMVLIVR